ncbi:MAG: DUF2085 domain-containing protein [Candidatus Coatesbacteria bacterium]|nr:MAG: DUF2085 domain-containing protein [Candidatus Coatesbacteria bacterium]
MIYSIFEYICHQLADRALVVGGYYMPCCARCAGIYCGFAATAAYYLFVYRRGFKLWPDRWLASVTAVVLVVNFVEYAATWWFGFFDGLADYPRFVLSLSLGWAGFVLLAATVTFLQFPKEDRPRDTLTGILPGLVLCLAVGLLPLTNSKPAWYLLSWAAAAGMVTFYGFFNYFPVALLVRVMGWKPRTVGYLAILTVIAAVLVGEWFLHRALYDDITSIVHVIYELTGLA